MTEYSLTETTTELKRCYEKNQVRESSRGYLGASELGHVCDVRLWLNFRKSTLSFFPAETLFKFDDGNYSETITAQRLQQTKGINLRIVDEKTGEQFSANSLGGHLRGNIDGFILGVKQLPNIEMIWEHKCVDQSKFNKVSNLLKRIPYERLLKEWDYNYFVQAQMYMYLFQKDYHFLTISSAGSRDYVEVITEKNYEAIGSNLERAKRIIASDDPGDLIASSADKFPCSYCGNKGICFKEELPIPNCRNCINCVPLKGKDSDGDWHCAKFNKNLTKQEQNDGCQKHIYNPGALKFAARQIDAKINLDNPKITYEKISTGEVFTNEVYAGESNSPDLYYKSIKGENK